MHSLPPEVLDLCDVGNYCTKNQYQNYSANNEICILLKIKTIRIFFNLFNLSKLNYLKNVLNNLI